MEKLKIGLVLDDSLDRGDGVQQYVTTLGSWLADQHHDVHYLVGESEVRDEHTHSLARNVGVRFNGNRLSVPLPSATRRIRDFMQEQQFDILHVQMPYSPFMSGKVIAAAGAETAITGTFHIMPFGRLQKLGSSLLAGVQRKSLARFDAICSVSEPAARFARQQFGIHSQVIPCMIDSSSWRTDMQPHPGRIVFLGRLVERKGCRQLLESLALLPQHLQDSMEVIIAGDGPEKPSLMRLAARKGLEPRFLGYIPEKQKASLLASAEIAVFPALGGESFGIVLLEAMAAGSGVVIGGDNPGYASVLGEQSEALVDVRKPAELASRLEQFLTDKTLRDKIHRMQHQTLEKYDVNTVGRQVLGLYDKARLHRRQEMR